MNEQDERCRTEIGSVGETLKPSHGFCVSAFKINLRTCPGHTGYPLGDEGAHHPIAVPATLQTRRLDAKTEAVEGMLMIWGQRRNVNGRIRSEALFELSSIHRACR